MLNQLNPNLTDALPADFSSESSRGTAPADAVGLGARFSAELNRSVLSQNTSADTAGTGLPASGNALPPGLTPAINSTADLEQSIEADLAGVAPDVLQSIYSDLGELAELSGGSAQIVDDAIAQHDRLFSAQALGLDGVKPLADSAGADGPDLLPGEARLPGPVMPGILNLQSMTATDVPVGAVEQSMTATDAPVGAIEEQATAGFVPLNVANSERALQSTDRAIDQLERTLQVVTANSRLNEQTVRSVSQNVPLVDAEALADRSRPQPAPVVNVNGNLSESERFRFRPVGLTPTVEPGMGLQPEQVSVSRNLTTDAVSRFESIGVLSEGLRTDASLLNKPSAGGFQVHTPSVPQAALPNTATLQPSPSGMMLSDTIQTGVQDQSWGDRIGERVALMANNRLQNAELRLTPAELGPLRVKVSIEDGLANVSFVAQHAVTRDAIEQAMPRLREMLEQQGINLGQSSVDEQGSNAAFAEGGETGDSQSGESGESSGSGGQSTADGNQQSADQQATVRRVSNNLLDTFV